MSKETKFQSLRSANRAARQNRYLEYSHLTVIDHPDYHGEVNHVEEDVDDTLKQIFAPDPVTGHPRSDLAIVMNKETRPEILQYIQTVLQQPIPADSKVADPDVAIEMVKGKYESFKDYSERLRELSRSELRSLKSKQNSQK